MSIDLDVFLQKIIKQTLWVSVVSFEYVFELLNNWIL